MWECIKTGAVISIAGRVAHGDLFRSSTIWVMNVASWGESHQPGIEGFGKARHAEFDTWLHWFGEYEDVSHNVSVVILPIPKWFDYEGRPAK